MGAILKVVNIILGVLAAIACLAAVGVILYSVFGENLANAGNIVDNSSHQEQEDEQSVSDNIPVPPGDAPSSEANASQNPEEHVHEYVESIDLQPTCLSAGRILYTCECGGYYQIDSPAVGHKSGDWEISREATQSQNGIRVKKCIYCVEILNSESYSLSGESQTDKNHVHEYEATVESEATCAVSGIRKYTCECGDYYKEFIQAVGHLADDWTEVKKATTTEAGTRQRVCTVCDTVIDSRVISILSPSPSPSTSPGTSPTPTPTPTATPSPTAHQHDYNSHVVKEANCSEKGIRTYNCSCGAERQEEIDTDSNKHNDTVTIVYPTASAKGYTQYTCKLCGYSYKDNEVDALGY